MMSPSLLVEAAQAQTYSAQREYQIKAALLYRFVQYVTWPESQQDLEQIRLCVFGENPFGVMLDSLDGKKSGEKTLKTQHLKSLDDAALCHLLFIGLSEEPRMSKILSALHPTGVLTVGETATFAQQGGMIRFYQTKNRIRFEINLKTVQQAELKISSKMLRLAKVIV